MVSAIKMMLGMGEEKWEWTPPVLPTQAHKGEGVSELYQAIARHRACLEAASLLRQRRQERRRREFMETVQEGLSTRVRELVETDAGLAALVQGVGQGELEPYSSALKILKDGRLLRTWLGSLPPTTGSK